MDFIIGERPTQKDIIATLLKLQCCQNGVKIIDLKIDGVPYQFDKTKGLREITNDKTA